MVTWSPRLICGSNRWLRSKTTTTSAFCLASVAHLKSRCSWSSFSGWYKRPWRKQAQLLTPNCAKSNKRKQKEVRKQVGGCVFACVLCCVLWACVFLYFLIFKIFDCFRKQWASFHMTNKKCKPHNGHLSKFEDLTPCVTMENDLNACLKKQKSCWREPFVPLKHVILHACFS